MFPVFIVIASFFSSYFLTRVARSVLARKAQLDIPNERSMHSTPVPRGGGIAVMSVIVAGMFTFLWLNPRYFLLLLATIMLMAVSWFDDRKGVSTTVRFCAHLLAAFIGSLLLPLTATIFGGLVPIWLDRLILVIGWTWFINLYNFMDGIDGITGVESICIAAGAFLILYMTGMGDSYTYLILSLIAGACAGFLVLNWHPAKIFLGDVGSIPLGFLLGFVLLKMFTQYHLWAALILPLYYLIDSGVTITIRAIKGEKVWLPHRQHFYQRAAQGLSKHDSVATGIFIANLGLIGASMVSIYSPVSGIIISCIVVSILIGWMKRSATANRMHAE